MKPNKLPVPKVMLSKNGNKLLLAKTSGEWLFLAWMGCTCLVDL